MIKIPKNLDELKKMVSETNVNEVLGKVKSSISTATEAVKSAAGSMSQQSLDSSCETLLGKLQALHQEQASCLKNLERHIADLHQQLNEAQAKLPKEKAKSTETKS